MKLSPNFFRDVPPGRLIGVKTIRNMDGEMIDVIVWSWFDLNQRCARYAYFDSAGSYVADTGAHDCPSPQGVNVEISNIE